MTTTEPASVFLHLQENGDLEGTWDAYQIDSISQDDFIRRAHDLTHVAHRLALSRTNRNKHILLAENRSSDKRPPLEYRALLVRPMACEDSTGSVIHCRFVGPVYFHSPLDSKGSRKKSTITARISNSEKMKGILGDAWDYMLETIDQREEMPDVDTTDVHRGGADEDEAAPQSLNALLYIGKGVDRDELGSFLGSEAERDRFRFPPVESSSKAPGDMTMLCHFGQLQGTDGSRGSPCVKTFFYGPEKLIGEVRPLWKTMREEMTLIGRDINWQIAVDTSQSPAQDPALGGQALQLLAEHVQGTHRGLGLGSLVTLLLDNGAPHLSDKNGQWPIHSAVKGGAIDIVRSILKRRNSINPNQQNRQKQRPIHLAAQHNRFSIAEIPVEQLKKDQENLNAEDGKEQTALIVASKLGHSEIAKLLLKHSANTTVRDSTTQGHITLHHAAMLDHSNYVSALLDDAKAEWETQAAKQTPESSDQAHTGSLDGSKFEAGHESGNPPDVAKIANLDLTDGAGMTALHLASQRGHFRVVKILIEFGAQLWATDSQGATALMLAVENDHPKTVDQLLELPARGKVQDDQRDLTLLCTRP